ncbi:MAG: polyphosphate polymerase domain-containing protein [Oscillospiraceae bacterium]|nr:polyphosphate polymerase domain-containing protein [Oscillospiraceae bacterium]
MEKGYRHEFKFLISRADAELLKLRLPHIMERDPHAGETGRYTIRSLYFDDVNASAYYEKVDGLDNRAKYRIRFYNYDGSHIKLEKKEKLGNLTRKTAQDITKNDARALEYALSTGCPDTPSGLTEELRLACLSRGLRPKVLVDYDRTPFLCHAGNTRITIDENLRTRPYIAHLFASPRAMTPVLEPDQVILEVKFDDFLPGYLADALADIPKVNMAVSKFAMCMSFI